MIKVRRAYIYGVCAVALWAASKVLIIAVGMQLARSDFSARDFLARQIAVIGIAGLVYLGHRLWADRLARRDEEERRATLRGVYLYGMMAVFLVSLASNLYPLLRLLLAGEPLTDQWLYNLSPGARVVFYLIPLSVLGLLWFTHWRQVRREGDREIEGWRVVRRWYVYGLAAVGLAITAAGLIALIRLLPVVPFTRWHWITMRGSLGTIGAQLLIGLPLWIVFWGRAQRLYRSGGIAERDSTLRRVYLYLVLLVGLLDCAWAAMMLMVRRIAGRVEWVGPPRGPYWQERDALSILLGLALLWAYHAFVVGEDAARDRGAARRGMVRQVALYLVTAAGLIALTGGLGGALTGLVGGAAAGGFGDQERLVFAWSIPLMIVGLPVYGVQWWRLQAEVGRYGPGRIDALHSLPRRVHLYLFLFLAALVGLGALVLVASKLGGALSGGDGLETAELVRAIGYGVIGAVIWFKHWAVLRADRRPPAGRGSAAGRGPATDRELPAAGRPPRQVVVVDAAGSPLGPALVRALSQDLPALEVAPAEVGGAGGAGGADDGSSAAGEERVGAADLILVPWSLLQVRGEAPEAMVRAVLDSPARKLLLPTPREGWEWVGVEQPEDGGWVPEAVRAVEQVIEGRPVEPRRMRRVTAGALIVAGGVAGMIVGGLVVLGLVGGTLLWCLMEYPW